GSWAMRRLTINSQAFSLAAPSGNCWHAAVAASRSLAAQPLNRPAITELRQVPSDREPASAKALDTSVLACSPMQVSSARFLDSESGWEFSQFKAAAGCWSTQAARMGDNIRS